MIACELCGETHQASNCLEAMRVQRDHFKAEAERNTSKLDAAVSLRDEWQKRYDGQQVIIDNLRRMVEEYSDVLRDLASYVGCGGYNSEGNIPAKTADEKIRWGIDHLLRVETGRREAAEFRLDRVRDVIIKNDRNRQRPIEDDYLAYTHIRAIVCEESAVEKPVTNEEN